MPRKPKKEKRKTAKRIRFANEFDASEFPAYVFDRSRNQVLRKGRDVRATRKTNRLVNEPQASSYHFRLINRLGEVTFVTATAIFPDFTPPPRRAPLSLEDFPDYYFDDDGTPHRYDTRWKDPKLNMVQPPSGGPAYGYYHLTDRNGVRRSVSAENLRRLVQGLPLKTRGAAREHHYVDPPKDARVFAEFVDYAFSPETGDVWRISFPVEGQEPQLLRYDFTDRVYVYDSTGRKIGFTRDQIRAYCASGFTIRP